MRRVKQNGEIKSKKQLIYTGPTHVGGRSENGALRRSLTLACRIGFRFSPPRSGAATLPPLRLSGRTPSNGGHAAVHFQPPPLVFLDRREVGDDGRGGVLPGPRHGHLLEELEVALVHVVGLVVGRVVVEHGVTEHGDD